MARVEGLGPQRGVQRGGSSESSVRDEREGARGAASERERGGWGVTEGAGHSAESLKVLAVAREVHLPPLPSVPAPHHLLPAHTQPATQHEQGQRGRGGKAGRGVRGEAGERERERREITREERETQRIRQTGET
eukprot:1941311-Rhodomonas_salina.1